MSGNRTGENRSTLGLSLHTLSDGSAWLSRLVSIVVLSCHTAHVNQNTLDYYGILDFLHWILSHEQIEKCVTWRCCIQLLHSSPLFSKDKGWEMEEALRVVRSDRQVERSTGSPHARNKQVYAQNASGQKYPFELTYNWNNKLTARIANINSIDSSRRLTSPWISLHALGSVKFQLYQYETPLAVDSHRVVNMVLELSLLF